MTQNLTEDTQTNKITLENRIYDELLPKNEPDFVSLVRNWEKSVGFVTPVRWGRVLFITMFHVALIVWFFYTVCFLCLPKWQSVLFAFLMSQLAGFGVTAGAHRHWSHRSYRVKWPLKIILIICYSMAGQNTIYDWVRDHRVHHKFSETSADPHDARRGFFFSHVGWLMMKKHTAVLREGGKIDMTDIKEDPMLRLYTKYFSVFKIAFCFVLPTLAPVMGWGESYQLAILTQLLRFVYTLHSTWSVNSFAHLWGNKPYDRSIMPAENWRVSVVAMGEGWHNYHHTFPWDYKASELGGSLNITTLFLNIFARIGWAYNLKVASPELVAAIARNRGER